VLAEIGMAHEMANKAVLVRGSNLFVARWRRGPKVAPGRRQGVPDPAWATRVAGLMQNDQVETLLQEATFGRMLRAGNVATELLVWIAMLGTVGGRPPDWMEVRPAEGDAYGIWGGAAA
jgi:protocatechuate 4,5-dioxygenase beta chain